MQPIRLSRRGLAASRWTCNRKESAILNIQRDVLERLDLLFTQGVVFENMLKSYNAHESHP